MAATDLRNLSGVSGAPIPITIAGQELPITPLCVDDFVRAMEHMNTKYASRLLEATRFLPNHEVRAMALAALARSPMLPGDVIVDLVGRLKLLELSLVRGGVRPPFESLAKVLTIDDYLEAYRHLFQISKIEIAEPSDQKESRTLRENPMAGVPGAATPSAT